MNDDKQEGGDALDRQRQADMLAEFVEITQAAATIGARAAKAIKGVAPEDQETKRDREKRLNAKYQADFRKRAAEKEAVRKAAEAAVRDQLLQEANGLRAKVGLPEKVMPVIPEQLDLVEPEPELATQPKPIFMIGDRAVDKTTILLFGVFVIVFLQIVSLFV